MSASCDFGSVVLVTTDPFSQSTVPPMQYVICFIPYIPKNDNIYTMIQATIQGIGHDVVNIHDFSTQCGQNPHFIRNFFSTTEIRQARRRSLVKNDDLSLHLAARWAGKEAFIKAWCQALSFAESQEERELPSRNENYPYTIENFPWKEVEILNDAHGVPNLYLSAQMRRKLAESLEIVEEQAIFSVSLSHDDPIASAVAIIQAQPRKNEQDPSL